MGKQFSDRRLAQHVANLSHPEAVTVEARLEELEQRVAKLEKNQPKVVAKGGK